MNQDQKTTVKKPYIAPVTKVVEFRIEKGFASSVNNDPTPVDPENLKIWNGDDVEHPVNGRVENDNFSNWNGNFW